jgi:hypothetical protein
VVDSGKDKPSAAVVVVGLVLRGWVPAARDLLPVPEKEAFQRRYRRKDQPVRLARGHEANPAPGQTPSRGRRLELRSPANCRSWRSCDFLPETMQFCFA